MNNTRNNGFSLLEAIVAMAIVASFGMAIFAWINANLNTLNKIQSKSEHDQIVRSVVEYMQDIDIMEQPDGNEDIGQFSVFWKSTLIEPIVDGANRIGGKSEFEVGLYLADVNVRVDTKLVSSFSVRLVGYKKVRNSMIDSI